jgi:hypothetical protein
MPVLAASIPLGAAVQLSTLVNNPEGSVTVGDKLFTDFTYQFTGNMPSAVGVNVVPIQDEFGNFGIQFQGAFIDLVGDGGSDALIGYHVTALDPNLLITDAHLVGNPNLLGTTGSASVTETFLMGSDAVMEIHDDGGGLPPKLTDQVFFTPGFRELDVQKDIMLVAGNGSATISFVDQTFSQSPIPEAATMSLAMIGGLGLALLRRTRK